MDQNNISLEKVIKGLECCEQLSGEYCRLCPYHEDIAADTPQCCTGALAHDALALLRAQGPIEPEVDVDQWRCGKCGHLLEHQEMLGSNILFHEQYAYCPNCGKAVKWE